MLLERDKELRRADGFLEDVRRGQGQVMVFEGLPGIGRTALLIQAEGDGLPAAAPLLDDWLVVAEPTPLPRR